MVEEIPRDAITEVKAPLTDEIDVLAPWGNKRAPAPGAWHPDILGKPFQCQTLPLLDDDEGEVVSTLVKSPRRQARFHLLYLHGRNDYFFQTELAKTVNKARGTFYALDLRKYGRSLRPWQTIGFADDLRIYDEDIAAALHIMRLENSELPLFLMGHSTGGLIATLWVYRHPGIVNGLILNSAWLELQKYASMKPALKRYLGRISAKRPYAPVISSSSDEYSRSLVGGWAESGFPLPSWAKDAPDDPAITGWHYAPEWKRPQSYPVPAAWFKAVIEGHEEIEKNAHVDCPVLNVTSTKSTADDTWGPEVFSSDVVLDVEAIRERAKNLSDCVTLINLPGKHDLTLSDLPVRKQFYEATSRWIKAVLPT
jgi:Lysophospholipase